MSDRLFKVSFAGRDELDQAASYLEVAARSPDFASAITVFVDADPLNGRSLYTTAVGIRVLNGFVRVGAGVPLPPKDLPTDVVRRCGPHLPLPQPPSD